MNEFDYEEYLDDYFDVMDITDKKKEERKEVAKEIREAILLWFMLVMLAYEYALFEREYLYNSLRNSLASIVYKYSAADAYAVQYLDKLTNSIVDTTMRGVNKQILIAEEMQSEITLESSYIFSDERATDIGANEANSLMNRDEYLKAIAAGYTYKTWHTEQDDRVRDSHIKKDGKRIPIKNYFVFDACKMLYPHDLIHGNARETVNCRCSLSFDKGDSSKQFGGKETGGHHYEKDINSDGKFIKATQAYEKYARIDDSKTIAENTEFSQKDIQEIRSHIFSEKHNLYEGYKRFAPDYDMAVAWKRLQNGNFLDRDITLLNHELLESRIEKEYNLSASEAHKIASQEYDWQAQLYNELGAIGEKDGLL